MRAAMRTMVVSAAFAGVSFASVSLVGSQSAAAEEWTCYTYIPNAQHVTVQGLTEIGRRIEQITDGEITVTCHAGGSLGISAADITAAVSDGVVQYASNAFITGSVPLVGIFSLPGLFSTEEELEVGLEIMEPYIAEAMSQQGLVFLGTYHYPRQVIFSTEAIDSLDDLQGKKVRVASVEQAEFATRFGGSPVTIGTPDVASALQLGTISVVLTAASGGARLWSDLLTSNHVIGPNYTVSPIFMNVDAWDELTAEQQEEVRAAVSEVSTGVTDSMRDENAQLTEQFASKGMTITQGTPEEEAQLIERLQDYWPQWAEERGDVAKEALGKVREALGK